MKKETHFKIVLLGFSFVFLNIISESSHAWGQYGHEQINDAAIDLVGTSSPIGQCLADNRYAVTRYAVTPDIEWKTDMFLRGLSGADISQRQDDNLCEHPLHYFEADAFIKDPQVGEIAKRDAADYPSAYASYARLLAANAAYVLSVDPSKAVSNPVLPDNVVIHGTAPWRVAQLYRLGVNALKAKNFKLGLMYLSTMGHYVGDMSQPYHASMNYDGGYYPPPQDKTVHAHEGIHHDVDTALLPQPPKDANDVFSTFSETSPTVMSVGQTTLRSLNTRRSFSAADIVPTIINLVDDGYAYVTQFLDNYARECDIENGVTVLQASRATGADPQRYCEAKPSATSSRTSVRNIPKASLERFAQSPVGTSNSTVRQVIEARLGASAGILAKLWLMAYNEAGKPDLGDCSRTELEFDQSFAIQQYPKPDYYPSGAQDACFNPKTTMATTAAVRTD